MRLVLRLIRWAVSDCWSFALLTLAAVFLLSQLAVLRKRYIYVGLLGLGCLCAGLRRTLDVDPLHSLVLMCVEILAFGNAIVFMFKHSWDNVSAVRERSERARARLFGQLEAMAQVRDPEAVNASQSGMAGGDNTDEPEECQ